MVVGGVTRGSSPERRKSAISKKERFPSGAETQKDATEHSAEKDALKVEAGQSTDLANEVVAAADAERVEVEMKALDGLFSANKFVDAGISVEDQDAYKEASLKLEEFRAELVKLQDDLTAVQSAPKSFWTRIVGSSEERGLKQELSQKEGQVDAQQAVFGSIEGMIESQLEVKLTDEEKIGAGSRKSTVGKSSARRAAGGSNIKGITS